MKKSKAPMWWGLILLIAAVAAIIIGYNVGIEKVTEEVVDIRVKEEKPSPSTSPSTSPLIKESPQITQVVPKEKEVITIVEIDEKEPPPEKDPCELLDDQIREFFIFLNTQEYIKVLEQGTDTYDHFKVILDRMMMNLPVPAGEGLAQEIMSRNIFHFFRILKKNDLKLLKEIIKHEEETLEMNLDIFYRWLLPEKICPDPNKIKPSLKQMYHYAGFFLNTIGGRAYLFRRTQEQRILINYYCMNIIYKAEISGLNSYGIDISPWIIPLMIEIESYPGLRFKDEYLGKLKFLQSYYTTRMTEN
jgi:hypothetical protein